MRGLSKGICTWAVLFGLCAGSYLPMGVAASPPLPPPPPAFVLDEPHVLKPKTLLALQSLLKAQEQATGEQVVFAIFHALPNEDLVTWTNRVFQHWKIGQKGKDNGALLALYWKNRKARIEVGYGLEPKLTDAKAKRILSEFLIPELKQEKPDLALISSAMELLRVIDSPLIKNGQAEKILEEGGFRNHPSSGSPALPPLFIWLVFGLIIFLIVAKMLFDRDTHFTRDQWKSTRRPRGRRNLPDDWGSGWGGGFGGGGGSWGGGSGGGGGGFSGGGGSSGGGGASGDW